MTQKWYATLRHPKMHPHTKFGIPTSKNIGDMDRTRKRDGRIDGRIDGRTDRRTDSAITICHPKFLWGHKKIISLMIDSFLANSADIDEILVFTVCDHTWSGVSDLHRVKKAITCC